MKKVVVMGGGTGTFPVVKGLKHEDVELSAIIAVSDSGGSTGRIRDEFGFPPVGDLRQALAALSEEDGEEWIRKILVYRFEKGKGLKGHNLGNLILTALQDMTGDTSTALDIATQIFWIHGQVIPVTEDNVQLQIEYDDGGTAVGEHLLDEKILEPRKIHQVQLTPHAKVNPQAAQAIKAADLVIIGPGDYYASLMATLVPEGMKEVFRESQAKIVFLVNLMARFTQTHEMSAQDHVSGIEQVLGKSLDHVLINSEQIPDHILQAYAKEKEYPVKDDLKGNKVIRAELLSQQVFQTGKNDTAHRSLLRHDSDKLRKVLSQLL